MTLNEIVCRAASVYPDCYVMEYWNTDKQCVRLNPDAGDTLAMFIAQELADTYDPASGEATQLATAIRVMQSAADDIQKVADTLAQMSRLREAA